MTDEGRQRILILDDSAFALSMAQAALESAGYSVTTASDLDGFEAERTRTRPDLILVDVQMPEAFGDDVAAMLRGMRHVTAPILLLSSLDPDDLARRAREAEVDGFISKRAGLDALVAGVRKVLGEAPGRQP